MNAASQEKAVIKEAAAEWGPIGIEMITGASMTGGAEVIGKRVGAVTTDEACTFTGLCVKGSFA